MGPPDTNNDLRQLFTFREMKKKKPKAEKEKIKPAPPQSEEEKDDRFNFGGLPPRDLKKNLGCG